MESIQIKTIDSPDFSLSGNDYNYQDSLTKKIDSFTGNLDQNIINEIVLWKINRYAETSEETLKLINNVSPNDTEINYEKTKSILKVLLKTRGIRLPMASTILRFRNPRIYQIIDQRVYRIIYGKEYKSFISEKNIDRNIEEYFEYLKKLKDFCTQNEINFSDSDRILYEIDKKLNKGISIKY